MFQDEGCRCLACAQKAWRFSRQAFANYKQQDAHEFLLAFLDLLSSPSLTPSPQPPLTPSPVACKSGSRSEAPGTALEVIESPFKGLHGGLGGHEGRVGRLLADTTEWRIQAMLKCAGFYIPLFPARTAPYVQPLNY